MFRSLNDKAYLVGGAVRDLLLGHEPKDRDYVIECTEAEFERVFPDAEKVGNTFPVYLHPETGDEIALTRTERPTETKFGALGSYQGFEIIGVGVSILDDLRRRDFTINSIAQKYLTKEIIDPTNGKFDLKNKMLRCVNSEAFNDDPLRIYRACRFAARFDFKVEMHTFKLMRDNCHNLFFVEKERVVNELKKMYSQTDKPGIFFRLLFELGGMAHHFDPILDLTVIPAGPKQYHGTNTGFDHTMEVIDRCKANGLSFDCFIACLFHDTGKASTDPSILPHHYGHENGSYRINKEFFAENRFDASTVDLALTVGKNHMKTHVITKMRTNKVVDFLRGIRRLDEFIDCCNCDHPFTDNTLDYINLFKQVRKETVVEIPKETKDKYEFVGRLYTKALGQKIKEFKENGK
jgi:tRNA nucleotidyltransferase (CCA-adding enzyme)